MTAEDTRYMRMALTLGARGLGRVAPWPSVGCVIVNQGRIAGRGTSDLATIRHAERVALDQAGAAARGATAYVTLEPCSHHGRTPPCSDALIAAGVARVVIASADPNPTSSGGAARLREAGIEVTENLMRAEAERQHRGFLLAVGQARPMVTLKLAASLDGRIATATGESRWITGPQARRAVHLARSRHDAVMIGGGTARADDPELTVRDLGIDRQPVRVVLSRRLDLPLSGKLAASARQTPLWICHGADADAGLIAAWQGCGAETLAVPVTGSTLDPPGALNALAERGITRVLCEGGGMLAASLLAAGLVDRLMLFTAGKALGAEGRPTIGPLGLDRLADAPEMRLVETRALGPDTLSLWERP